MDLTGAYEVVSGGAPVGRLTVRRTGPRTEFDFHSDTLLDVCRLVALGDGTAASIGIPVPKDGGLALTRSFSDAALAAMGLTSIRRAVLIPADADVAAFAREESTAANAPEANVPEANTSEPPAANALEEHLPAQSPPEIVSEPPPAPPEPVPEPEPQKTAASPEAGQAQAPLEPHIQTLSEDTYNFPKPANANTEGRWVPEPDPGRFFADEAVRNACRELSDALRFQDGDGTALAFPWSPQEPFPLTPFFREGRPAEIDGRTYILYRPERLEPEPS